MDRRRGRQAAVGAECGVKRCGDHFVYWDRRIVHRWLDRERAGTYKIGPAPDGDDALRHARGTASVGGSADPAGDFWAAAELGYIPRIGRRRSYGQIGRASW